jgi:exopolysaccharide biosynthesis polyprenyl glycosylphosphotransferase
MNRPVPSHATRAFAARTFFASLLVAGGWAVPMPRDARFVPWVLVAAAFLLLARAAIELRHTRISASRIVVLGTGRVAAMLIEELEALGGFRGVIAGVVDDEPPRDSLMRTRWLGPLDRLGEIVEETRAERIVVALEDRRGHLPLEPLLATRMRGVVVEDALEYYERVTGTMAIDAIRPGALILSKGFRNSGTPETVARFVSVVAAIAGLICLAPLFVLLAIAIKLDSRGPILFAQDRAGRDGRPFKLLKFRTMHPCDTPRSEWVDDNKDRITRLGWWLRRFRFDELPQLVNMLRGEMNLVGPRPHPMVNQRIFMERIAYYGLRSTVRPGVTGWAQVRHGYANNIEEETRKMHYDLYYIKNRSLLLDARILVETVAIILFGQGSSGVRRRAPLRERTPSTAPAVAPLPSPPVPQPFRPAALVLERVAVLKSLLRQ